MMSDTKKGGFLGTTLLIAGTTMGGGMIGMPIVTGLGGFIPSLFLMTLVWLCMMATAFLVLEATLGMPEGANMLSMAETYFGKMGKYLVGTPYLLFYFCVLVSYPGASGPLLAQFFENYLHISVPEELLIVLFTLIFGTIVFLGVRVSDRANVILMIGFFVTFFFLFFKGTSLIKRSNLSHMNWTFMFLAGPILFTSFCFHYLIPTLVTYLQRDVKLLKQTIFTGMTISYLTYLLWNFLWIGASSEGALWEAFERGGLISQSFNLIKKTPWLGNAALLLAFFGLVTSLIGLALGLIDFLGDGFRWPVEQRRGRKRLLLCALLFVPMVVLASIFPLLFLKAIGLTGGFIFTLLNGLLPISLAWRARYHLQLPIPRIVPGGRIMLLALLIFTLYIIYLQAVVLVH